LLALDLSVIDLLLPGALLDAPRLLPYIFLFIVFLSLF
jgi:hypothetical protein